jgi:hypothetical protein
MLLPQKRQCPHRVDTVRQRVAHQRCALVSCNRLSRHTSLQSKAVDLYWARVAAKGIVPPTNTNNCVSPPTAGCLSVQPVVAAIGTATSGRVTPSYSVAVSIYCRYQRSKNTADFRRKSSDLFTRLCKPKIASSRVGMVLRVVRTGSENMKVLKALTEILG